MRRRWLREAVRSTVWRRGTVTTQRVDGSKKLPAVLLGDWAVHREAEKGGLWNVTHAPSGLALASGLATQRYAKQLVQDMLRRHPELQTAKDPETVRPYAQQLRKVILSYQQGLAPDQGKMNVRAATPVASSTASTARLRRLADLGDREAKAELRRQEVRSGAQKEHARPVGRVADIRPWIASAIGAKLPHIGRRTGKSGVFYGMPNHSRAISVGTNTVLANVYQVGAKHYPSLGGKPRIETSWVLHRSYPIKDVTQEVLDELIAWAKKSVPTRNLRSAVRYKLQKAMDTNPGKSSYYEVVYG